MRPPVLSGRLWPQPWERANTQLARVEQIKRYAVLPQFWYPDGDELTPTLKVRRRVVAEKYRDDIDALYANRGARPMSNQQFAFTSHCGADAGAVLACSTMWTAGRRGPRPSSADALGAVG